MKIASIGEVLWDVLPGAEHLGGAPFNFAFHARNLGHEVCFVSAVGNDDYGSRVLARMAKLGLTSRFIRRSSDYPTGTVTVTLDPQGLPRYKIHRPAAYDFPVLGQADLDALLNPAPDWIYFGTLQQTGAPAHELTMKLLRAASAARHFYDVNLRADSFTPELVRTLAHDAHVLKLNEEEFPVLQKMAAVPGVTREQFCRNCLRLFHLDAVCITLGAQGCALLLGNEYLESPGYPANITDTIGAGDAFSAALVHGLTAGWPAAKIADFANRVGALVASRPGGTPHWTVTEAMAL